MKKFILIFFAFILGACSTGGAQFLRGHYYFTGDSNCKYSRERTDTSIDCYNSDDELTGYRNAMTDQQLQMYRHNQQMEAQSIQQNKTVNCFTNYGRTTCY